MKIFKFFILFLLLFTSCTSDKIKEEEKIPPSEICCTQSYIGKIEKNDSAKVVKGWGGVDPNAEFAPTTYPLDHIYLIAPNDEDYTYESLPIPIQGDEYNKYFDICYRADENGNVFAMSEGKIMQVGPEKRCFFSSSSEETVGLTQSQITTPSGTVTYEPYGDGIFRSEDIFFSYEKSRRGYAVHYIWGKDKYQGRRPQLVTGLKRINMYRGTFIVVPRLVICDGYPNPEEETATGGTYILKKDTLEKRLGPMEEWNVRFFLAGKKGQDDYPTEISLDYLSPDYNGFIIGTTDYAWDTGIVALTENPLLMRDMEQQLTSLGGKKFNYVGYGVHDASFPFLYKGTTFTGDYDLCCTLYHGDESRTIRFPLNDLSINDVHLLNYVVDVDDIAKAFGLPYAPKTKLIRGIERHYDESFGEIVDIPAIIINN